MGQARHPLSLALTLLALGLAAPLAGGCGSSEESTQGSAGAAREAPSAGAPAGAVAQGCAERASGVAAMRVTGIGCAAGRGVIASWSAKDDCLASGASRASCTVGGYRCLGAVAERGLAISCARPGRSISFIARRR